MIKLKVIIKFSVYNKYYKPPKMKVKLDKKTGMYVSIDYDDYLLDSEDKDNPLYITFKVNDILEITKIIVHSDSRSFAYVTYNNKTHEVPLDTLSFCTEKL